MSLPIVSQNVRALRSFRGLKQAAFAQEVGVDQSYVSKWEKGTEPSSRPLARMAELAGCTVDEFLNKPWEPPSWAPTHGQATGVAPDTAPTRDASSGETTPIVALDLSLSMGPGTPIEDFVESQPVEFDIGLLRTITRSPYHRLRIVRGIGDSMEPKFLTGDRILVDTTERTLSRIDGFYLITLWGAHGLKRLRPAGRDRVLVISENREYDPIEVDAADLTIEGRAIWFGRDL